MAQIVLCTWGIMSKWGRGGLARVVDGATSWACVAVMVGCSSTDTGSSSMVDHTPSGAADPAGTAGAGPAAGAPGWTSTTPCSVSGDMTTTIAAFKPASQLGLLAQGDSQLFLVLDASGNRTSTAGRRYDVVSIALPCGMPSLLTEQTGTFAAGLAYADGALYWADDSGIRTMPASGGPVRLDATPGPFVGPQGTLAVRNGLVVWRASGTVVEMPVAGGASVAITSSVVFYDSGALAIDGTSAFFETWMPGHMGMPTLYGINRVPLAGGDTTPVISPVKSDPAGIAVAASALFWFDGIPEAPNFPAVPGALYRMALHGDATPVALLKDQIGLASMQIVDGIVYFESGGGSAPLRIRALDTSTNADTVLVEEAPGATVSYAVSSNAIYWVTSQSALGSSTVRSKKLR